MDTQGLLYNRSSAIQQIKLENEGSFEGEFDEESLFGNSNCLTTESTAHCYRKVKTNILRVQCLTIAMFLRLYCT